MMMVEHGTLKPGEKVKIGNQVFILRYITSHAFSRRYHFSPGNVPLDPLVENDVVTMSVNKDQALKFEVVWE